MFFPWFGVIHSTLFWPCFKANLRKCKQNNSVDLRKILHFKLPKHAFFRGETSIFSKKGPFCKELLGPKRDPFVRQNFKCGPLCKAIFRQTIPVKWHTRIGRTPPSGIIADNILLVLTVNHQTSGLFALINDYLNIYFNFQCLPLQVYQIPWDVLEQFP